MCVSTVSAYLCQIARPLSGDGAAHRRSVGYALSASALCGGQGTPLATRCSLLFTQRSCGLLKSRLCHTQTGSRRFRGQT